MQLNDESAPVLICGHIAEMVNLNGEKGEGMYILKDDEIIVTQILECSDSSIGICGYEIQIKE